MSESTHIKTHFLYTDKDGALHQVALGFLPFVPRVGETITFVTRTNPELPGSLWDSVATFRVERCTYECFGMTLPISQTWETVSGMQGAFQVNLYVMPLDDEKTQTYLQRVIEVDE